MGKYVHKNGRVCRVFNTPFTDWNEPPNEDLDFPQTLICENEADLRSQIGDCVVIDRPQATPKAEAKAPGLPIGAIISALAGMDIPQAAKDALLARQAQNPEVKEGTVVHVPTNFGEQGQLAAEISYQNKMLQEFRLVMAGIGTRHSKEEAEAIGNFILSVDDSLEQELVKIKLSQTSRRFTL